MSPNCYLTLAGALSDLNPQSNFGKRRDGGVVYAGTQQFRVGGGPLAASSLT